MQCREGKNGGQVRCSKALTAIERCHGKCRLIRGQKSSDPGKEIDRRSGTAQARLAGTQNKRSAESADPSTKMQQSTRPYRRRLQAILLVPRTAPSRTKTDQ